MQTTVKSKSLNAIDVMVNGRAATTVSKSLLDLVEEYSGSGTKVATAVNGEFVPERLRKETQLKTGDKIEIVSPRQGG